MTRVPFHTQDTATARKLHPTECIAMAKIIAVLIEATQAHYVTITIIVHLPSGDRGVEMVPLPPLMGAQVVAMITKSLPTNLLVSRTAAVVVTLANMGLVMGPAAMRGRAMVAGVETEEGMRKNPADMDTNVWRSSLPAVSACD